MIRMARQLRLGTTKGSALIPSQLLQTSYKIQTNTYLTIGNVSYVSLNAKYLLQSASIYCYSQVPKQEIAHDQSQSTQVISQSEQKQSIIDVEAVKSTMLFMDTGRLSSIVRMNRIKKLFQVDSTPTLKGQSLFACQNDKIQLSSFDDFDKRILSVSHHNQYLSKGNFQDYQTYPIIKLTQICLRFIHQHHTVPHSTLYTSSKSPLQHWKSLEYYIWKRMHNCSSKDYMKIVYIVVNAYRSVYRFNVQFIESTLRGLRREVQLMEEHELMQLFLVVSQGYIRGRDDWEREIRFSQLNLHHKANYKFRSPFFQHENVYECHQDILEKIVKRYQNKFMNTELAIKEQELFKLLWWCQILIGFRNESFGHLRDNSYSSLVKNKFLVGLVKVLSSKLHPQLKNSITHKIKGQLRQIESKQIAFRSVKEMVRCFEVLGMMRDYLNEEGQEGLICEGSDEKAKEVRLRAETWVEKGKQVNDIIESLLDYQSVKDMIQSLFDETKSVKSENVQMVNEEESTSYPTEVKRPETQMEQFQERWKLIEIMNECANYNSGENVSKSKEWYLKLINEFKVFDLLEGTSKRVHHELSKHKQSKWAIWRGDRERLMRLGESQLKIVYELFNKMASIKRGLHGLGAVESIEVFYSVDWRKLHASIVETCFYLNQRPEEFVNGGNEFVNGGNEFTNGGKGASRGVNETNGRLIETIRPETVLKMVNFEIACNKLYPNNQPEHNMQSAGIVIGYADEILGKTANANQPQNHLHYIRQLQFPIYTYLTIYISYYSHLSPSSPLILKAHQISSLLLKWHTLAQQYLQEYNHTYQQLLNNSKHNPFITNQNLTSINNYKALASTHGLIGQTQRLLEAGDALYTKENVLTGEFIMSCVHQERKRLLRDEAILALNKFFTQIKAFKDIRFYHPVTAFMVCPQFLFLKEYNLTTRQQKDSAQPMMKGIYFMSRDKMAEMQVLALKQMYSLQGIEVVVIEARYFLDMHINERIQTLNKAIFGTVSQKKTQSKAIEQNLQQVMDRFCRLIE